MFKFWFENIISVVMPIFAFIAVIAVFYYAVHVNVTVPPAENVEFVQQMRAEVEGQTAASAVKLENPHMADTEMKNWTTKVASEALSFNRKTFSETIENIRPYFTDSGFTKYQEYLISSGIAENLRTSDYDMSVYIQDPPLLLNSLNMDGKYKWLYRMPVVISFIPMGEVDVTVDAEKYINKTITLRLQITRAVVDENPDAILVEDWVVVPR